MEMRWARVVCAKSSNADMAKVGAVSVRNRMGESAGFTLRKEGGLGKSMGSLRAAREMAAWTSWAAASMLRSSTNCMTICVEPCELLEVIESMPAMVENSFSRGVATAEAIVSGLAPG